MLGDKTFDLAGNIIVVLFEVANEKQKQAVLDQLEDYYLLYKTFILAVPTGHSWWKINPVVRLMGIADYHTLTSWLWIDALLMKVFVENDRMNLSEKMFAEFSRIAERDGEIGETYFVGGKVYKKRFWKSASPFAWSSGVLLKVLKE